MKKAQVRSVYVERGATIELDDFETILSAEMDWEAGKVHVMIVREELPF